MSYESSPCVQFDLLNSNEFALIPVDLSHSVGVLVSASVISLL